MILRTPWMAACLTLGALGSAAPAQPAPTAAPTSQPGVAAPADDLWTALDPTPAEARPLPRRGGAPTPAAPGAAAPAPRTDPGWLRSTLSLAGVTALIVLLGWGYRQVASSGKLGRVARGRHPAFLEVVSRTMLAPRQSVCLVRVGPRLVLVGLTPTQITALDVIQDPDLVAQLCGSAAAQRRDSRTAEFSRALAREEREYPQDPAPDPAPPPADEHDYVEIAKARIAQTRARLSQRATPSGAAERGVSE